MKQARWVLSNDIFGSKIHYGKPNIIYWVSVFCVQWCITSLFRSMSTLNQSPATIDAQFPAHTETQYLPCFTPLNCFLSIWYMPSLKLRMFSTIATVNYHLFENQKYIWNAGGILHQIIVLLCWGWKKINFNYEAFVNDFKSGMLTRWPIIDRQ